MSIKKDIVLRTSIVYILTLVFGLVILGRIIQLQFFEHNKWQQKSQAINIKNKEVEPNRGEIYDCNDKLLATSLPFYEIRLDLKSSGMSDEYFYDRIDSLSIELSKLFRNKNAQAYKRELINAKAKGNRYYLLKRQVNYNQLKKMKTFPIFELGRYKGGFMPIQNNRRIQPYVNLARRTIGYMHKGGSGVGLEGAFNEELSGVKGIRVMQKLAAGGYMPLNDENEIEPKNGMDVVTTLDVNIQDVATHALFRQLSKHNASSGVVVLMEVETGDIKAIANLSKGSGGIYDESYNFAIAANAEPGSTFKLPVLMAAMEDGFVELADTFDTGNGVVKYYDAKVRDSNYDKGGYGKLSVQEIFEKSSNVGVALITDKFYGKQEHKFVDRIYAMKLNKRLGIPLVGEATPVIHYPKDKLWSGVSLVKMAYGYGLEMTPLQMLTFYNAVANDGKMMRPRFVKELRAHGETAKLYKPSVISSSICSKSTIKKAKIMLEGVVERGTATNLRNDNYKIAGKTGTAQIVNGKKGYRHKGGGRLYQASFCGYFPADNPKYSCIVVINSPSSGVYYGNIVAGPVFKEISDKLYATSLAMHENRDEYMAAVSEPPYSKTGNKAELNRVLDEIRVPMIDESINNDWVRTHKKDSFILVNDYKTLENLVPNVKGMAAKDALFLLENLGLKVEIKGRGSVRRQSVTAGSRVKANQKIRLEMTFI